MSWSWLLTLICPMMMILMMFGMPGGHGHRGHGGRMQHKHVEELEQELSGLKAQNEQLRTDLQRRVL
ncbi:hypothetical protein NST84_26940 [Paenibacillus sp. FSL R7-0345]|uniref:hypothetical protein n=1 Tax=Paenibacillus sp. FSL R7-0345 TaxID=2954535 RepID=UPI00315AEDE5